jgi:peroxiredoxin
VSRASGAALQGPAVSALAGLVCGEWVGGERLGQAATELAGDDPGPSGASAGTLTAPRRPLEDTSEAVSENPLDKLPPDLPRPEDDGAADGLEGRDVPPVRLETTAGGRIELASVAEGTLVVYLYPRTGLPGEPPPPGWMETPGAFGCTAENCAFRDHAGQLAALGARVVGVSAQPLHEQREFAAREVMPYPLLNDSGLVLAEELDLPTFRIAGMRLYRRLTFVARRGRIGKVFYPVFPPDEHASEVLSWLAKSSGRPD